MSHILLMIHKCFVLAILAVGLQTIPAASSAAAQVDPREEHFEKHVRPFLIERCYKCHGPDEQKSSLRVDSREFLVEGGFQGPAVFPGNAEKSKLIQVLRSTDQPKLAEHSVLEMSQIEKVEKWIADGAYWPEGNLPVAAIDEGVAGGDDRPLFSQQQKSYWAFQPVEIVEPPAVANEAWVKTPIDRFILAGLEAAGVRPAPPAGRPTLIRRMTFDLTGLPPSPEEIEAFVNDPSPFADVKVVNRLLESPRYGERWGRHWLDVARFAESAGHDGNNAYLNAWRYRDYVIEAFNKDKPYNQFVIEQLAGDLLPKTQDVATDLERMVATGFLQVGPKPIVMRDKKQMVREIADEQLHATGVAFMALTLGCARCHDHKFDPIPTEDYYSLTGIFLSTVMMEDFLPDSKWIEYMVPAPGGSKVKVMGVKDQPEPRDARVHVRGSHKNRRQIAPRRFLQIIAGVDCPPIETTGSGRLELAQWIASEDHPLTSRVMVNRIWQWHFGTGLVASSGDFGSRGGKPSHPELLDWLARAFVESGWSIKQMHRLMVLSATYRQACVVNQEGSSVDPQNQLLWRMPRRRLSAEEIRDALLALGGSLDVTMGGSDFDYEAIQAGGDADRELYALGSRPTFPHPKRSVYMPVIRNFRPEILRLFDGAVEHEPTTRRGQTTVAPQSLLMMNSAFIRAQARGLAEHITGLPHLDERARVEHAFLSVLGRLPNNEERKDAYQFLDHYLANVEPDEQRPADPDKAEPPVAPELLAWQSYCQALMCLNEFIYVE